MKIDVLTLFPDMFIPMLSSSIIGRAVEKGLLKVNLYNIRDFAKNKHKQVDDYPYGGGHGMILAPQPLFDALYHVLGSCQDGKPKVILMSPQGKVLNQELAKQLAQEQHMVIICGHYEGVDQRVIDKFVDLEVSIGDYVLTGGELPAMVFIDCVARLIPGVVGNPESTQDESFARGLLEYPQYTRPYNYEGYTVPDVLLSGNHQEISRWRLKESLRNTLKKRPDLLEKAELSPYEIELLKEVKQEMEGS
ncbi:tRNA (guanosine(37)-N1)-methyltransferase TrmD [Caldicoprobacter algeriensis]|uniref:tRNA (guanosine(37)-N1)-methyltransferase TrmD n=1 Tax=Caldicoprobacter algeriensis TaxID=699281 RepID=UPI002079B636|nr:tRNA (guanosine(37)-N1)-methyltransferase TrmD [Caldicoprobacter algeriensis]MCM8901828.1 tRNA (guanosine(37)-N1)-methyltransferase TrmD [Caldicoprobacter algeriensis]